eukprot:TRINITY_DN3149_c0_g2_i2.p1 TRINITY_DN3149_c0_g2~~TRINITY_DN3149_c0_g2_i2.p1  ORF type:complete len:489 (+),score=62.06 TRINITY_DN3149_c0_g2_i2:191-1468(+)
MKFPPVFPPSQYPPAQAAQDVRQQFKVCINMPIVARPPHQASVRSVRDLFEYILEPGTFLHALFVSTCGRKPLISIVKKHLVENKIDEWGLYRCLVLLLSFGPVPIPWIYRQYYQSIAAFGKSSYETILIIGSAITCAIALYFVADMYINRTGRYFILAAQSLVEKFNQFIDADSTLPSFNPISNLTNLQAWWQLRLFFRLVVVFFTNNLVFTGIISGIVFVLAVVVVLLSFFVIGTNAAYVGTFLGVSTYFFVAILMLVFETLPPLIWMNDTFSKDHLALMSRLHLRLVTRLIEVKRNAMYRDPSSQETQVKQGGRTVVPSLASAMAHTAFSDLALQEDSSSDEAIPTSGNGRTVFVNHSQNDIFVTEMETMVHQLQVYMDHISRSTWRLKFLGLFVVDERILVGIVGALVSLTLTISSSLFRR